jgi:mRNA-degrading endonuclease RelE of RelBE toxin-antitoxin system
MTKAQENLEKEALLQYSREYLLKKRKGKQERALLEDEAPRYVIYARKSTEDENVKLNQIRTRLIYVINMPRTTILLLQIFFLRRKVQRSQGRETHLILF